MVALRAVVAARAGDALGSPDRLLRGVQQAIQHLADCAVLAVERIGIHGQSSSRVPEHGIWLLANSRCSFFSHSKGLA